MDTLQIAICTDKHFVMPAGVMMYSVCANNMDTKIIFHVIVNSFPEDYKQRLKRNIAQFKEKTIIFYDLDAKDFTNFQTSSTRSDLSTATYYRLYIPDLLPQDIDKVIYMDCDIIVRHPLEQLWNTDLEGCAVGAVLEAVRLESRCKRLEYNPNLGYFNAGILLYNLSYFRTHQILQQSIELIQKHPEKIIDHDQDIMNCLLAGKVFWLSPQYNLTTHLLTKEYFQTAPNQAELMEAYKNPTIVHFTCSNKPWHTLCRHPFRKNYLYYKSQTLWKDEPLKETRPLGLRIKKFFSQKLRRLRLIPQLPPYGREFVLGLSISE